MATDDVRIGRAVYRVAKAVEVLTEALYHPVLSQSPQVLNEIEWQLTEARKYLAAVDRGKLAASESPEETP